MKIDYGRVSTRDQNPSAQRDALTAAGCDRVFIDKASGKLASRPELARALLVARAGDQLVVTKLDRPAAIVDRVRDPGLGERHRGVGHHRRALRDAGKHRFRHRIQLAPDRGPEVLAVLLEVRGSAVLPSRESP